MRTLWSAFHHLTANGRAKTRRAPAGRQERRDFTERRAKVALWPLFRRDDKAPRCGRKIDSYQALEELGLNEHRHEALT